MTDANRLFLQDMMTLVLSSMIFLVLFVLFSFVAGVLVITLVFHLIAYVISCSRLSLLKELKKYIRASWRKLMNARLEKINNHRGKFMADPEFKTQDQSQDPCQICLEPFKLAQDIYRLPCALRPHCFHGECFEVWAAKSTKCPACRTQFA